MQIYTNRQTYINNNIITNIYNLQNRHKDINKTHLQLFQNITSKEMQKDVTQISKFL